MQENLFDYREIKKLWFKCKSNLANFIDTSEKEVWLDNINLIEFNYNQLIFEGLNDFFCNWVRDNRANLLKKSLLNTFNELGLKEDFKLVFRVNCKKDSLESLSYLNPENRFSSFVNGENTSMAYACSVSVSDSLFQNKKSKYNPLFIYGDVGLGKTHLMQSIGNEVLEKNKTLKIIYCTSEKFTNDVIEGIRKNEIHYVKKKYRNCDLFLIDDIQFLEHKTATQEEFFHTFNDLINKNKQIIITADRYPREIKNIERRITSRFSAGIITKIDPPNFETRVAVIKNEIDKIGLILAEDVILHIAHAIKTNIREIKGVIKCLEAEYSLLNQEINLDSARIILKDILNLDKSPINISDILKEVSKKFEIKISDLKSEKRDKDILIARQVAIYISREITNLSYPVIGRYFEKNHVSIIQSYKRVKLMLDEDMELKQSIDNITSILNSKITTA